MKGVKLELINTYIRRIKMISELFRHCRVELLNIDFLELFDLIEEQDFVYFDPPYLGKRMDYYGREFTVKDWNKLIEFSENSDSNLCISNWYSDFQGINKHIKKIIQNSVFHIRKTKYRYNLSIDSEKSDVLECIITNKKTTAKITDLPNLTRYLSKAGVKV